MPQGAKNVIFVDGSLFKKAYCNFTGHSMARPPANTEVACVFNLGNFACTDCVFDKCTMKCTSAFEGRGTAEGSTATPSGKEAC